MGYGGQPSVPYEDLVVSLWTGPFPLVWKVVGVPRGRPTSVFVVLEATARAGSMIRIGLQWQFAGFKWLSFWFVWHFLSPLFVLWAVANVILRIFQESSAGVRRRVGPLPCA